MFGSERAKDVFGLNRRNRELISRLNSPRQIALANDKIACKAALKRFGIETPDGIAVLRHAGEMDRVYSRLMEQEGGFVLKPSQGSRGLAVFIFTKALEDEVQLKHGAPISRSDLQYLVSCIVSGEFTHGRPLDAALIEERLRPENSWVMPDLPGPPDLRVIVHQGQPVMCMVRLPTKGSAGRANLHRGAVGLGIDMQTGLSTHGIWRDRPATHHPDSGLPLAGHRVEGLQRCLELSRLCSEAVGLGYFGVDIMLDRKKGPCVLELNARPGLSIQMANRQGLGSVLC